MRVVLGNEKPLHVCCKYRTSIFRYVKYAYEPCGTVLPYCYITVKLFMQLVSIPSILDFSIPFMFSRKVICIVIYRIEIIYNTRVFMAQR